LSGFDPIVWEKNNKREHWWY